MVRFFIYLVGSDENWRISQSTRRREADGSMPVREANEPRERSDSEAIWSPDADFYRSASKG